MIYITGDMHRDFSRLNDFPFEKEDMLIILGDVGINYCLDERDNELKRYLELLNITLFCVRGNHEERPENIHTYQETTMFDGKVYLENEFPHLIFAKDGETYNIAGKRVLVIGGAYSVDKKYRIACGYKWFNSEQLDEQEKNSILSKVKGQHFDIVLSHTCPYKYEPVEVFLPGLDQFMIDKSMERFLNQVEKNIDYDKWYCGHYHTEKQVDKLEFMFKSIHKLLLDEKNLQDKTYVKKKN